MEQALLPACTACGFTSVHIEGEGPCSVRCALLLAKNYHQCYNVPLDVALRLAKEEAESRGLPPEPYLRDIREGSYRYVLVQEVRTSNYWKLDRLILQTGLHVEYTWTNLVGRARIYRFAPSLLLLLPDALLDYKIVRRAPNSTIYWHFLSAD